MANPVPVIDNRTIKRFVTRVFTLALATMWTLSVQAEPTSVATSQTLPRLDVPITPANSVLYDFGYGAILRVPKILFPESAIPKDPNQPIKSQTLSMVFQFPDIVQAVYPSAMSTIFQKDAGRYVPQPDRFPVNIVWMFYSPGELGNVAWRDEKREVPDFRPTSILRNSEELSGLGHTQQMKSTFSDSKYEGLREVHFPIYDQAYYDKEVKLWKERGEDWIKAGGTTYVERISDPYELYMKCDDPSYIKCQANVYIKSNHFQYRMIFPPEAVSHTDQLIRTINKMIDGWIQK